MIQFQGDAALDVILLAGLSIGMDLEKTRTAFLASLCKQHLEMFGKLHSAVVIEKGKL